MYERETVWRDHRGSTVQISIAWLSEAWEPVGEVTEQVGPFDDLAMWREHARNVLVELGVDQLSFELDRPSPPIPCSPRP